MTDSSPSQTTTFDGKTFARKLTGAPGVYRMFDAQDQLLYVGKALSLRKRVASYFARPHEEPRLAAMVAQIARIDTTVTRTESEALMLEAQLIKSLNPRYNILLRDDKSYPYIRLSKHDFPRLTFHRGARDQNSEYFGPYPSVTAVRETINLLQKLFRIRNCTDSYFRNRSRPCLQYQIKRCSAPCVAFISEADYTESVRHARMFLEGRSSTIVDELGKEMERASSALEFEQAATARDSIAALQTIQARHYVRGVSADMDVMSCVITGHVACVSVLFFRNGINLGSQDFFPRLVLDSGHGEVLHSFISQYYLERPVPAEIIVSHPPRQAPLLQSALTAQAGHKVAIKSNVRADRARFLELARHNAEAGITSRLASRHTLDLQLEALRELLGLAQAPQRIECFDISHTMGEATVASCVVFGPEGAEKSHYRRFNIRDITPGDDYAAMHQALTRRYRRVVQGDGALPDLLLIDGGKGQVNQALDVLTELGVSGVMVVGVAKGTGRRGGDEHLVVADSGQELYPGATSAASHLIQTIRDEAHRFAISGHRARRQKARNTSTLEDIPGIGVRRRAALLRHFGGLAGVSSAGVEELMQVKGISRDLATRIYGFFHG